jgi:hypothetical protein
VTSLEYLRLDLTRPAAKSNTAQIGRSISADAGDGMAALASLRVKDKRTAPTRIRIERVGN